MNLLNNKLMDLIDPKFFITSDTNKNNKKRKLDDNSHNEDDESKQPNKKQRLINDMEITSKTTHIQSTQQNPKTSPKKLPFGSTDINENEYIYVSNEEYFKKLLIREKEKYNLLLKKLNNLNLINNNNKRNFNSDNSDNSDEEVRSQTELLKFVNDDSSSLITLIDQSELFPLEQEECFLCSWGNSAHDEIYSKDVNRLKDIYRKYRPFCRKTELANMLYLYYMNNIYDINGKSLPKFTPSNALNHIRNIGKSHTKNADEHVIEGIETLAEMCENFKSILFRNDGGLNKDAFNCFKDAFKTMHDLYKVDLTKLNFRDHDMIIDLQGPIFKRQIFNENDENILKSKKITSNHINSHRTFDT